MIQSDAISQIEPAAICGNMRNMAGKDVLVLRWMLLHPPVK